MKYILLAIIIITLPLAAQEYAFIYIEGGSGTNSVGTTWTNVGAGTSADFVESSSSSNWSYSGNVLTAANNAAVEGNYCIKYSLSFNGDAADWSIGISIDGAAPEEPVFIRSISNARKDAGNVSGIYMASITQGQTVELVVKADAASNDFTPIYAQLVICPAAQNSENLYAGMHLSTTNSYVNLGTAYTKLTGFSSVPEMNGWTFGTSDMTAGTGSAGLYYVSYSISFTGDGNETSPIEYSFELARNDSNSVSHIMTNRSTSSLDIGNVSAGGLLTIKEGDVITLEGKAHLNNNDLSIHKATVSLFKLGDTSPNAVGGMTITSDQSLTVNAQNEWTTIGNYTLKSANLWGLSSNVFTLNSTNAYGYYFMEYTTSLSTANASGDDVELGVFVGNTLNSELTVSRRLSSNTDIGAVCGIGLFRVNGPDSTLTLKIRNTTSSNNITIKKSMVGFSQIRYVYSDTPLPISLKKFNVERYNNSVKLYWETASEIENLGFRIYRSVENGSYHEIASFTYIDDLKGQGTTAISSTYEFTDVNVESGKNYTYLLADVSYQAEERKHVDAIRSIYLPYGVRVGEAYPNPFNPLTTIPFKLDNNTKISIDLYDALGRKIKNIADEYYLAGSHSITIQDPALNTGLYFVRILSEDNSETRKILLLK